MKKPNEYTKIKNETIVGFISFVFLFMIVTALLEVATRIVYQKTLNDYIFLSDIAGVWINIAVLGLIIAGMTMVVFIIIHSILTAKDRMPKIEGIHKIWNPFNKTRFIMNKRTERPDVIYFVRRPQNWFNLPIPRWIKERWDKLVLPIFVIVIVAIIWFTTYANSDWVQVWIVIPLQIIIIGIVTLVIAYFIQTEMWQSRKAVVTQEEWNEMLPHLVKADKLIWGFGGECYYKSRFWIVSKEDYDKIVLSLKTLVVLE